MPIRSAAIVLALALIPWVQIPVAALANPGLGVPGQTGAVLREGFGAASRGGAGGTVLTVTSTAEAGAGTLRWALEEVEGPRIVVFDVEGEIALTRAITVDTPFVTIDGRTAPGDGIVVTGARLHITAGHVIVTGMQFRPGDAPEGDKPHARDGLSLGNGAHDVLIVGNSFAWGVDENVAVWGDAHDVSIVDNMIGQALRDSIHIDEGATEPAPHSMGLLIGASEEDPPPQRITVARNLLFSNQYRNPYVRTGTAVEFYNNYVHNYGAGHQGMSVGGGNFPVTLSLIGNIYEDGPDTPDDPRPPFDLRNVDPGSAIHLRANLSTGHRETLSAPEAWNVHGSLDVLAPAPPFDPSGIEILPPGGVIRHVENHAGAFDATGNRRRRDAEFMTSVTQGTSRIVDAPAAISPRPDPDG